MPLWFSRVMRSFGYAWSGVAWAWRTQRNIRLQSAAAIAVTVAGAVCRIAPWEWCVVWLAMGLVGTAELLNTAIECLCDRVTREADHAIRRAKDAAAGGVLLAALAALIVGLIIFLPKFWP